MIENVRLEILSNLQELKYQSILKIQHCICEIDLDIWTF